MDPDEKDTIFRVGERTTSYRRPFRLYRISEFFASVRKGQRCRVFSGEKTMVKDVKQDEGSSYYNRSNHLEPLLAALLDDPILSDVPKKPSVSDVETLIGVELGSAMKLTIVKLDNTTIDVAVLNTASVRDLKGALQKKVDSREQSQMGHRHISCAKRRNCACISRKHVWSNFCLTYNNEKLVNDDATLREFGVKNNDELQFARHVSSREAGKHSRAKKRRFFHGLRKA